MALAPAGPYPVERLPWVLGCRRVPSMGVSVLGDNRVAMGTGGTVAVSFPPHRVGTMGRPRCGGTLVLPGERELLPRELPA